MNLQDRMGEELKSPAVHLNAEDISSFVAGIAETNPRHTDAERSDACAPRLIVAKSVIPGSPPTNPVGQRRAFV